MYAATSPEAATLTSADAPASVLPVAAVETVPLAHADPHAGAAEHGTTTAEHGAEHGSGGLPQLDIQQWGGQIVWLVIIFVVLYLMIGRVFAPRLRKAIDTRSATIAEDLANARANRDEAEAQAKEAAAETATAQALSKKLAAEAIAKSNAEIAAAQAVEDVKLNARLSEAEARIKAARDEAMSHVRDIASETASALVQKLTGKAATQAALRSAQQKV
jgi:F-type H+-transporting ATPase subunit b